MVWALGLIVTALGACGSPPPAEEPAAAYLPERLGDEWQRTSPVRVFAGDSLWEYIDGDAEIYHAYHFAAVATADYRGDGRELVVDVYRFRAAEGAYGLFTAVRPDDAAALPLGAGGFGDPYLLCFAKGEYFVRVTAFAGDEEDAGALRRAGDTLDRMIPGGGERPAAFAFFPDEGYLAGSDRLYGGSFLGHSFLSGAYSQCHLLAGDTVTLFLFPERGEERLHAWQGEAGAPDAPQDEGPLSFPPGSWIRVDDAYYGPIVAGLRGSRLVGVINYAPGHEDFLARWIETLPR